MFLRKIKKMSKILDLCEEDVGFLNELFIEIEPFLVSSKKKKFETLLNNLSKRIGQVDDTCYILKLDFLTKNFF